ncbi:hypothetical protein ACLOJK_009254 [Asimina triloba]
MSTAQLYKLRKFRNSSVRRFLDRVGDLSLSLMAAKRKEEEGTNAAAISIIPPKRIRSAYSSSSASSSSVTDGYHCRASARNPPPKNQGFFGLVEIASLAAAEFKSLNIVRKSKKRCNPMPMELPKPDCWRYVHPSVGGVVDFHVFLFERELTKTDVNPSEARLFMNKKEMKEVLLGALRRREEELVFDRKKGLEVQVIDRLGNRYKTCLKFWQAVQQFALFKDWKKVVEKNQLVEGDMIRVWFFRYGDGLNLGFFIMPVKEDHA